MIAVQGDKEVCAVRHIAHESRDIIAFPQAHHVIAGVHLRAGHAYYPVDDVVVGEYVSASWIVGNHKVDVAISDVVLD